MDQNEEVQSSLNALARVYESISAKSRRNRIWEAKLKTGRTPLNSLWRHFLGKVSRHIKARIQELVGPGHTVSLLGHGVSRSIQR